MKQRPGGRALAVLAWVAAAVIAVVVPDGAAVAAGSGPSPKNVEITTSGPVGKTRIAVTWGSGHSDVATDAAVGAGHAGGSSRGSIGRLRTVILDLPNKNAPAFIAKMRAKRGVSRVSLVEQRFVGTTPNDPYYAQQSSYLEGVAAPTAWDLQTPDQSTVVAVVDSGVDVTHPDLVDAVVPGSAYNAEAALRGGDVTDVRDSFGHGTFVAGIIAASSNNGSGVTGAASGAGIMPVKVMDATSTIYSDAVARGIVHAADAGVEVINLSIVGPVEDPLERDAIAYAVSKGVVVVAAAGNSGSAEPFYPAAEPGVLAVGGTNGAGGRASFSNYGSWVSVAAPAVAFTSTSPLAGSSLYTTRLGYAGPETPGGTNGTSFAAPLVSAEAALVRSADPTLSAAAVRTAITSTARGYAGLGLGSGQVDFAAALRTVRPRTTPTLTAPSAGAVLTGPVSVSAHSTAPQVRFRLGTRVATVPVTNGVASATLESYGVANGSTMVTAVDCSSTSVCSSTAAAVVGTTSNPAPVLTAPAANATVGGSTTFTASASGGAVAFLVDGVKRGVDLTAPYSLAYTSSQLSEGAHTLTALSCTSDGSSCLGPSSAGVPFTVRALHPAITSTSPSILSPNADGRQDSTLVGYRLPEPQAVSVTVRSSSGTVVRGPIPLGTQATGTYSYRWNGYLNGGTRAASGSYAVWLSTSKTLSTGTLQGAASTVVSVDNVAPVLSSVTGHGTRFFPYVDGYKDAFTTGFSLSEASTVTLTVRSSTGAVVRTVTAAKAKGAGTISWNGRTSAGALLPAGTYSWRLTVQDRAGLRTTTPGYGTVLDRRRLVTRSSSLVQRGTGFARAGGSDTTCAAGSTTASRFAPYGLRLVNSCGSRASSVNAVAIYRFTLPSALSYSALRLDTYGYAPASPSTVVGGLKIWSSGVYLTPKSVSVNTTTAWRVLAPFSPSGLVQNRVVEAVVLVPNDQPRVTTSYDISHVRLLVTYQALVS